jgi:hypothetical protein
MSRKGATCWINVSDLEEGMNEFKLPATDELIGKELKLYFNADNQVINYVFHDVSSLTWEVLYGPNKGESWAETYEAIRAAPNIFFIDFVKKNTPNVSVSMVLDLNTRKATVIIATAPTRRSAGQSFVDRPGKGLDLSTMKVEILHANVNPPSSDEPVVPHERTTDLIGKRNKYIYSSKHVYEHIYLNDRLYTWHCLKGPEKGLADTDICDYFKIAPDVYLFTWREKIIPTVGIVIINLKEMRSNGKIFGLDPTSRKIVNFTIGSRAELINERYYS